MTHLGHGRGDDGGEGGHSRHGLGALDLRRLGQGHVEGGEGDIVRFLAVVGRFLLARFLAERVERDDGVVSAGMSTPALSFALKNLNENI